MTAPMPIPPPSARDGDSAERRAPGIAAAALTHAMLWLHGAWSEQADVPLSPLLTSVLLAGFAGAAIYVYWRLAQWLVAARDYEGSDHYLNLAAGLTLVDAVVRLIAMWSGSDRLGGGVMPLFGPYSVIVGYQYAYYFAAGTVLIALGYSLMRAPDDGPQLRRYGQALIATGMCYAAFLGGLAIWPGVAADLLLAWRFRAPAPTRASLPLATPARRWRRTT